MLIPKPELRISETDIFMSYAKNTSVMSCHVLMLGIGTLTKIQHFNPRVLLKNIVKYFSNFFIFMLLLDLNNK